MIYKKNRGYSRLKLYSSIYIEKNLHITSFYILLSLI
jgi:hypothetical protein